MKKLLLFLTILIFTLTSNIVFADIIAPREDMNSFEYNNDFISNYLWNWFNVWTAILILFIIIVWAFIYKIIKSKKW